METVEFFGIPVLAARRREDLLFAAAELIGKGGVIATVNPYNLALAREDVHLRIALRHSLNIPDGRGVATAARLMGVRCAVYPGVELGEALLDIKVVRLAVIGGKDGVAERALLALSECHSNVTPVLAASGFGIREGAYIDMIRVSQPDVVFICTGTPRQELFARKAYAAYPNALYITLGGSADIYSGEKRRAPLFVRRIGMEWAWRCATEWHRFPRLLRSLSFFRCVFEAGRGASDRKSAKNH